MKTRDHLKYIGRIGMQTAKAVFLLGFFGTLVCFNALFVYEDRDDEH